MNVIYLYQVWERDKRMGAERSRYTLHLVTSDLEEAQRLCQGSNGDYVYSYLETFCGENG